MNQKPFVVGIAGGTGSGKTTLAIRLYQKYKDQFALVHLDDYFKHISEVPFLNGFTNWEDPSALRFDALYEDLSALIAGKSVTIQTKSELFNPHYNHDNPVKIAHRVDPKPLVVVEGFMVLYDPRIRDMLDLKVFLEAPLLESSKRRSPTKDPVDQEYFDKILAPMYTKFVEPTKQFADMVIDVSDTTPEDVELAVRAELTGI